MVQSTDKLQSMENFASYLANLPKTPLVDAVKALYEASEGDIGDGSAWDNVERIHVYHAADPRMDMDIKLDSLWATRQKGSATRQDVIDRFVDDVQDFNKWLSTSDDGGSFITSAAIKFKGDPDEVTVKIPCHGTDINTYENNLYESVDNAQTCFKTLEELRDFLDRAAYGTFENSEYDQYEQEPYGSLENIQEVDMAEFVKDMSGMNHDIQSLVGQPIDDKTLNQLVYDWFVCLHTRGAVGWQYNWN